MYTATMEYRFKDRDFKAACDIWAKAVLEKASKQPGLISMQLLSSSPTALAIGTWKSPEYAQDFMKTGIFKDLIVQLKPYLAADPVPKIWECSYYQTPAN